MSKQLQALIFDCDGVLVNTERDGHRMAFNQAFAKKGFNIEWEKAGSQYRINEISCPYYKIGQNHPEVCAVDQTLISKMLALPASKVQCILNGDSFCTYVINSEMEVEK